jgi:membrane protease subunit HflK
LKEYKKAKNVTRKRLYLETMERILPGIRKFVIDPRAGGNLLQFLPLEEGGSK